MPAPIADLLALSPRERRRVTNVTGMRRVDRARMHAVDWSFRPRCQRAATFEEQMAKTGGQANADYARSSAHTERLFAICPAQASRGVTLAGTAPEYHPALSKSAAAKPPTDRAARCVSHGAVRPAVRDDLTR